MKTFISFLRESEELTLEPLPYGKSELEPIMSSNTINYHYSDLARGYVERFNKREGDPVFNKAGAFLHNLFFTQFMPPKSNNKPDGMLAKMINEKFGSFNHFKRNVESNAMKIQGSGWIYLSTDGTIKTIPNHQVKKDILLIIDWWEHAWALDYQSDKNKYLDNIWSIIDWSKISIRFNKTQ